MALTEEQAEEKIEEATSMVDNNLRVAHDNIKRLADELSVEKGKVAYLEGEYSRANKQRNEAIEHRDSALNKVAANDEIIAQQEKELAHLQGQTDRANDCPRETREATSAKMKYIVVKEIYNDVPIIFSGLVRHSSFKNVFNIISAGFCVIKNGGIEAFGKSDGLDLSARKEDSELLTRALNTEIV